MSGRLVVKRYVRALVAAGEEAGILDAIEKDVEVFAEILKENEIRDFCLKSPDDRKRELDFVRTAFVPYVGEYTGRFLVLLAENGRIAAIPFVRDAFDEIMALRKGLTYVTLEIAYEPDEEFVSVVEANMSRRVKGKAVIDVSVNPSLLGGMRILWRNRIVDMSLRGNLNRIRNILKQDRI